MEVAYLTHMQIHENIALGNPALANDSDKVREAARLASAEEFIDDLPGGFNTYIKQYDLRSEAVSHGNPIDPSFTHRSGGPHDIISGLSGGQMQRLAVYEATSRPSRRCVLIFFY